MPSLNYGASFASLKFGLSLLPQQRERKPPPQSRARQSPVVWSSSWLVLSHDYRMGTTAPSGNKRSFQTSARTGRPLSRMPARRTVVACGPDSFTLCQRRRRACKKLWARTGAETRMRGPVWVTRVIWTRSPDVCFCSLKAFRRIATRYEKTDASFAALLNLVASFLAST
jgi:hypothetical protein